MLNKPWKCNQGKIKFIKSQVLYSWHGSSFIWRLKKKKWNELKGEGGNSKSKKVILWSASSIKEEMFDTLWVVDRGDLSSTAAGLHCEDSNTHKVSMIDVSWPLVLQGHYFRQISNRTGWWSLLESCAVHLLNLLLSLSFSFYLFYFIFLHQDPRVCLKGVACWSECLSPLKVAFSQLTGTQCQVVASVLVVEHCCLTPMERLSTSMAAGWGRRSLLKWTHLMRCESPVCLSPIKLKRQKWDSCFVSPVKCFCSVSNVLNAEWLFESKVCSVIKCLVLPGQI